MQVPLRRTWEQSERRVSYVGPMLTCAVDVCAIDVCAANVVKHGR